MNILIAIFFLIFATFTSSTLIRRQDALNGFKECQGNFPNKITSHEFTPNPIVAGQVVTVHMRVSQPYPLKKVRYIRILCFIIMNKCCNIMTTSARKSLFQVVLLVR